MEKPKNGVDPFAMLTLAIVNGRLNKHWTSGVHNSDVSETVNSILQSFKNCEVATQLPPELVRDLQAEGWEQKLTVKLNKTVHFQFGQFHFQRPRM